MWISPRFNAIYVHCPKTGGTSIRNMFEQLDPGMIIFQNHRTASQGRAIIHDLTWNRMYKFSTCRHPCDQLVSHYCNIVRIPEHAYYARAILTGFSDWLRWKEETPDNRGICAHFIDLPMDHVMRFENLGPEVEALKEKLQMTHLVGLPGLNIAKNKPRDWRDWFTPADIDYVREQFRSDFEQFGYEFPSCEEARRV